MSTTNTKIQRISFDDVIMLNCMTLRGIGVLKFPGFKKSSSKTIQRFLIAFMIANVAHLLINMSYILIFPNRDLDTLLSVVPLMISVTAGILRYLSTLYHMVPIERALEVNKEVWSYATRQKDYEMFKNYGSRGRTLTAVLLGSAILTVVFFSAVPLLTVLNESIYSYSNSTGNIVLYRQLPIPSPFENLPSPYYELAYVAQVISSFSYVVIITTVDALSAVCIILGIAQFKLLNSWLSEISRQDLNGTSNYYENEERGRKLKTYLRFHRSILEYCCVLEDIVTFPNLSVIVSYTYISSLCALKIVRGGADFMKFMSFLIVALMHILVLCYPADYLSSESSAIAVAFYNYPWYNGDKSLQSSIQIAIARSQIPSVLTAGKFVTMSLETFTSIISTATSFFTVLKTM